MARSGTTKRRKSSSPNAPSSGEVPPFETQFVPGDNDDEELWKVIQILDEDQRKGKYLVAWEGTNPNTGKPWEPTWEPKENCTDALILDWKKKVAKKEKEEDRRSTDYYHSRERSKGQKAKQSLRRSARPSTSSTAGKPRSTSSHVTRHTDSRSSMAALDLVIEVPQVTKRTKARYEMNDETGPRAERTDDSSTRRKRQRELEVEKEQAEEEQRNRKRKKRRLVESQQDDEPDSPAADHAGSSGSARGNRSGADLDMDDVPVPKISAPNGHASPSKHSTTLDRRNVVIPDSQSQEEVVWTTSPSVPSQLINAAHPTQSTSTDPIRGASSLPSQNPPPSSVSPAQAALRPITDLPITPSVFKKVKGSLDEPPVSQVSQIESYSSPMGPQDFIRPSRREPFVAKPGKANKGKGHAVLEMRAIEEDEPKPGRFSKPWDPAHIEPDAAPIPEEYDDDVLFEQPQGSEVFDMADIEIQLSATHESQILEEEGADEERDELNDDIPDVAPVTGRAGDSPQVLVPATASSVARSDLILPSLPQPSSELNAALELVATRDEELELLRAQLVAAESARSSLQEEYDEVVKRDAVLRRRCDMLTEELFNAPLPPQNDVVVPLQTFQSQSLQATTSGGSTQEELTTLRTELDAVASRAAELQASHELLEKTNCDLQGEIQYQKDLYQDQVKAFATAEERLRAAQEEREADTEAFKDMQLFRDLYSTASAAATAAQIEARDLSARNAIVERQVKEGVAQARLFAKQRLSMLEEEVAKWKGIAQLELEKSRRTDDDVRRRAAQEPGLQMQVRKLSGQVERLEEQAEEAERTLRAAQRLAVVNRGREDEHKRKETVSGDVPQLGDDRNAEELVYRCEWWESLNGRCMAVYSTKEGLWNHILSSDHIPKE